MEENKNANENLENDVKVDNENKEVSHNVDNSLEYKEFVSKKGKNNNVVLIISIIIILLILIGGYFLLPKILKQNSSIQQEEKQEQTPKEEQEIINYNGELILYKNSNDYLSQYQSDAFNEKFILQTETENSIYLASMVGYLLYNDNGLKIYNIKTKERKSISFDSNYDYYRLVGLTDDNPRIIGIEYGNYESLENNKVKESGFYNIELNKKMYENKYQNFTALNDDLIIAEEIGLISEYNPPSNYLLKIQTEKEYDNDAYYYGVKESDNNEYFIIKYLGYLYSNVNIYNKNYELIEKNIECDHYTFDSNNNLYVKENNILKKYNNKGIANLLFRSFLYTKTMACSLAQEETEAATA